MISPLTKSLKTESHCVGRVIECFLITWTYPKRGLINHTFGIGINTVPSLSFARTFAFITSITSITHHSHCQYSYHHHHHIIPRHCHCLNLHRRANTNPPYSYIYIHVVTHRHATTGTFYFTTHTLHCCLGCAIAIKAKIPFMVRFPLSFNYPPCYPQIQTPS